MGSSDLHLLSGRHRAPWHGHGCIPAPATPTPLGHLSERTSQSAHHHPGRSSLPPSHHRSRHWLAQEWHGTSFHQCCGCNAAASISPADASLGRVSCVALLHQCCMCRANTNSSCWPRMLLGLRLNPPSAFARVDCNRKVEQMLTSYQTVV